MAHQLELGQPGSTTKGSSTKGVRERRPTAILGPTELRISEALQARRQDFNQGAHTVTGG